MRFAIACASFDLRCLLGHDDVFERDGTIVRCRCTRCWRTTGGW